MSVLSVNLKHFYQRRSMWLVYLVVGLFAFSFGFGGKLAGVPVGKGHFIVPVALQFLVGVYAASTPIQILIKPFSYCLPAHRAVPRKLIFTVGIVTSLLGSLVLPGHSRLWWPWALVTCSLFCAGLTVYLIGAVLVFGVKNSGLIVGLGVWLFFGAAFCNLHVAAERLVIEYPIVIVPLGLAGSVAAWIWLGRTDWSRRFCAIPRLGWLDVWDQNKIRQYTRKQAATRWDKLKNHPEPWVERFFLGRMSNCDGLRPGRYIWGGLYTKYGMALSCWKRTLPGCLAALAFVLCLSYWRPEGTNIIFLMLCGIAVNTQLPVHSSIVIPGGRNERFLTATVLAGSIALVITAVLAVMVTVSTGLAPIMPDLVLRGVELSYQAMSLQLLVVPAVIVPISLAVRLLVFRYPYSTFASLTVMAVLLLGFGFVSSARLSGQIDPALLTGLLVLSWLALVLVLRHVCMKRSLAGQARTY